mgnify:CR=1 FL=1
MLSSKAEVSNLEAYFKPFREEIVGVNQEFESPYGNKKIIYADWTASGRIYKSIEEKLLHDIGPYVANTHTETSITGSAMTLAYHDARNIIKKHVNATDDDVLITVGTGMTGAINKFQRILGLKVSENLKEHTDVPDALRPIIFVSHMEHHSNQTSWLETIANVEVIPCTNEGVICLDSFSKLLEQYKKYPIKIAAITGCSNVTGIRTDYHKIAKMIHQNNGLCFVDFACSAPYVDIDMHPVNKAQALDAIFFSPHKFLGGPGSSGVLIFNKALYKNKVPDHPGGGTVTWTNPWGSHSFFNNIEIREDGGTPGFLQCIRTALAIRVKEAMGTENIAVREKEIVDHVMGELSKNEQVNMLEPRITDRLAIVSFYITNVHYNLVVRLLNDKFGIQTRGGCSCAGTYGHILLNVDHDKSQQITQQIDDGDFCEKPGWIRASFHPTTTNEEVTYVIEAINILTANITQWSQEYRFNPATGDFQKNTNLEDKPQTYISINGFKPLHCGKNITTLVNPRESRSMLKRLFS